MKTISDIIHKETPSRVSSRKRAPAERIYYPHEIVLVKRSAQDDWMSATVLGFRFIGFARSYNVRLTSAHLNNKSDNTFHTTIIKGVDE